MSFGTPPAPPQATLRGPYPESKPYTEYRLPVSDGHNLYVMEAGNPRGAPVVFVHGGPGGGVSADLTRYFDPQRWRIILFDQRGAGRSTPHASVEHNTTWKLVADMESLREKLGLSRWHVFGGSWGSTLALAYAASHPHRCTSLTLRGIFLLRRSEIHWFYQHGASELFPDAWEAYLKPIPEAERHDLLTAYHRRLFGQDDAVSMAAARAWSIWEGSTSKLTTPPDFVARFEGDDFARAFARIECHYFVNQGFFPRDGWLLERDVIDRFRNVPAVIIQGRYDVVCPARTAWDLHRAWPEADFHMTVAGHAAAEDETTAQLVAATDRFVALG
jgi:proline iminopeptidase